MVPQRRAVPASAVLNALTSPHAFLGGNVRLCSEHRQRAERGLALLALSLHPHAVVTLADAARALIEVPCGASGKDYLGYLPDSRLHSALASGLARFATLMAPDSRTTRPESGLRSCGFVRAPLPTDPKKVLETMD
ncbi:hypothetical protein GCM10009609_39630 [Pseudonocardia aurantiaca]